MPRRNTNPRHLWYKVRPNATPIAQARVDTRDREQAAAKSSTRLFDRHREAPDHPGSFLQADGVVLLDSAREPYQAFVVADRGDCGSRQGRCPPSISLDVWHEITSCKTGPATLTAD
jgi:hypothetical protein